MITNPQLFLLWTAVFSTCYWLIPAGTGRLRRLWLILGSSVLVFTVAPYAAMTCLAMSTVVWLWTMLWPRVANVWLLWMGIFTLATPLLAFRFFPIEHSTIITLGIAFLTFKSIGTMIDAYLLRRAVPFADILLLNFFFPIYSSGPIESLKTVSAERLTAPFDGRQLLEGGLRIAIGLFKSAMLCETVLAPLIAQTWPGIRDAPSQYTTLQAYGYIYLNLTYIYINFSGYTDLAIGVGRIFGLELTENFNFPFVATNILRFWQRWHMSLGNWVLKYMYFPMIRISGHVFLPIVITFFIVGLWHDSTLNYLIWGLTHGLALGTIQSIGRRRQRMPRFKRLAGTVPYQVLSWAFTMTFVCWLSAVANSSSVAAAGKLSLILIGFSE